MPKRTYRISDEALIILSSIKEEQSLKTDASAIEFALRYYSEKNNREAETIRLAEQTLKEPMVISAAASRSADQKLDIVIDAINAILIERGYRQYYPVEQYPSQIIEKSKAQQKEKLARAKQLKDDNALRKR